MKKTSLDKKFDKLRYLDKDVPRRRIQVRCDQGLVVSYERQSFLKLRTLSFFWHPLYKISSIANETVLYFDGVHARASATRIKQNSIVIVR